MKKLYKLVTVGEGFALLLDGKGVKTPDGHPLRAPNQDIADVLVREWAAQDKEIIPANMPFTQIISTKLDRVIPQRDDITQAILKYLDTDLLCYRAAQPPTLAEQQAENWNRWLDWFEQKFGARLLVTDDLQALTQPRGEAGAFITTLDDDRFNILQLVTSVSGSLVLALAFIERAITPEQVFACMRVEENYKAGLYNEEQYGAEPMQAKRDAAIRADLAAAAAYLGLLKP